MEEHTGVVYTLAVEWYRQYQPEIWTRQDAINAAWIEATKLMKNYDKERSKPTTYLYLYLKHRLTRHYHREFGGNAKNPKAQKFVAMMEDEKIAVPIEKYGIDETYDVEKIQLFLTQKYGQAKTQAFFLALGYGWSYKKTITHLGLEISPSHLSSIVVRMARDVRENSSRFEVFSA